MRGIEREVDWGSLSVGVAWVTPAEVTAKIASAESKSERIVESSITLVRCENAENAELRSR